MNLTKRQYEILEWIGRFIGTHGYSPTFSEIAKGCELSSLATVAKHVEELENRNMLHTRYRRFRSIELEPRAIDLLVSTRKAPADSVSEGKK